MSVQDVLNREIKLSTAGDVDTLAFRSQQLLRRMVNQRKSDIERSHTDPVIKEKWSRDFRLKAAMEAFVRETEELEFALGLVENARKIGAKL